MPQRHFRKTFRVFRKTVSASQNLFLMKPMLWKTYLGQKWNLKNDSLIMKPLTDFSTDAIEYIQRKIFSLVYSISDPFGILSPLTIRDSASPRNLETWEKVGWTSILTNKQKTSKIHDSYFEMPEVYLTRALTSLQYSESSAQLHVFVDVSTALMAAVAYLRITQNESEVKESCFLTGKFKVAPMKQTSVPKLNSKLQ